MVKNTKIVSFAEGIKALFTRGALVSDEKIILNNNIRYILTTIMEEWLENTSTEFGTSKDEQERYENFMESMEWLKQQISKGKPLSKIKLSKPIACRIYFWIIQDNKFHHLSNTKDFDNAMAWVINKISKKYSIAEVLENE